MENSREGKGYSSTNKTSTLDTGPFLPRFFFEPPPEDASLNCLLPASAPPTTRSSSNHNDSQSTHMISTWPSSTMDFSPYQVKINRSSASAIPRPTSGTSRRATPTGARLWNAGSLPHVQTQNKIPHLHRKSCHPSDPTNSSSFSLPSTTSSKPPLPSFDAKLSANTGLPKSRTFGSLLASSREVTPSGRLMQPIQPPLPRSQTLGNISCFNHSALTPSPRKPTQAIPDHSRSYHNLQSQLDVSKVLQESRMTEKEMYLMKNVQRGAALNRTRMRNTFGKAPITLRTSTALKACVSHVSASDDHSQSLIPGVGTAVDSESSNEQLPAETFRNQSLGPNYNLQEGVDTDDLGPLHRLPMSPSRRQEGSNPKDVYGAESTTYWTGRFVSVCDCLRMENFDSKSAFSGAPDNKSADLLWEVKDRMRIETAVSELRNFCKTAHALHSFANFETRLFQQLERSQNNGIPQPARHGLLAERTGLPKSSGSDSNLKRIWIAPSSPEAAFFTTSRVSSINAEATLAAGPKSFYGLGGIAKSKTTGHLASLIPLIQARSIAPTTSHIPKLSAAESSKHRRKTSYFDCSPETRAQAMKERGDRAARRVAEVRRRSEGRLLSTGKIPTIQPHPLIKLTPPRNQRQRQTCSPAISGSGEDVGACGTNALATGGHEVTSSLRSAPVACPHVEVHTQPDHMEKLEKSRRKAERQFSGEIVKSFFGAGMREMRRMGRRVGGGMVWSGSHEDLSLSANK